MKRLTLFLIILLLMTGGYTALCFAVDTDRALPNTTVNDTDLSNMTLEEAIEALKDDAEDRRRNSTFSISYKDNTYMLSAGDALELDYESAADKALQKSQTHFFARGFVWLKSHFSENHIPNPPVKEDVEAFHNAVKACGLLDIDTSDEESYKIEDGQLLITAGAAKKVDEDKLRKEIIAAIQTKNYQSVTECPLTANDTEYLELIYEEIHTEPVDATLDPDRNYAFVDSVTGVDFDKESAKKALSEAGEGSVVAVDLIYTKPEITTQYLKEHLFADTLGIYTTKVKGTSNRLTNVRLASEKCDGSILLPDDIFSFNNTVGEQTAARGFQTADAILDGEIVQAYGGGICQVSSTIFAAALYANLDIPERWNHDYVSSYISAGLDAAVAWGALDLLIANSTPFPVKIDVHYSGDDLTVTILGTRTDDSLVEVRTETLKSSPDNLLEVVTYRDVYTNDKSQLFHNKVAYSAYAK